MNRFLSQVVDHPLVVTALVIVLTGIAAMGYYDPGAPQRWVPRLRLVQPQENPEDSRSGSQASLPNVTPERVYDADTILIIESDELFSVVGIETLRAVVQSLESLPQVERVRWLDRVPILNVFGLPEPIIPRGRPSETQVAAARRKALQHPLVVGQFLSTDAKTMLLMVKVDWLDVRDDADVTTELAEAARKVIAGAPGFDAQVTATGPVPLYLAAVSARDSNQLRYQLIAYGVIGLVALVLFRGPAAVFVVSLAPALGVFWTLGFLRYFQLADNPFNDVILPTLLSLVGLTDGVHVMVQIRQHRSEGMKPREAARLGTREVGLACVLTSLTTAIGLGSLGLAEHEVVQEFGWCAVLGVTLTLIAVLTVIPLASSTILGRRIHSGHATGWVQGRLAGISGVIDFVIKHRRAVSAAAILSTLVLAGIALRIEPDERRQRGLPEGSEAARGIQLLDRVMGGLETAEVVVRWSPRTGEDDAQILAVLNEVHALLASEPLIGHPLSIARLIEGVPGSGPEGNRMAMVELLPPPLKRAYYVPERSEAKVVFRVQDLGIAKYAEVFERVEGGFDEIRSRHPEFQFELGGRAVFRWRNLYRVVVDLATSLGTASLIIFAVLALVYRSVRIGLIAVVPNVFPLALTATGLYLFDQGLELVSVCAFTVCLGIAVDDTIHFMTRYLECCEAGYPTEQALSRSFVSVGTALITTTIVLVAGFSTVLLSDSREHLIFAWMGISTFFSALFADLFFLPALLAQFAPNRRVDQVKQAESL